MGLFSKQSSLSCESAGTSIADHCADCIDALKSTLPPTQQSPDRVFAELCSLCVIAHRVTLQLSIADRAHIRRVAFAFDSQLQRRVRLASIARILDKRGPEYFALRKEHDTTIRLNDWGPFGKDLMQTIHMNCYEGGDFNMDAVEMCALGGIASRLWSSAVVRVLSVVGNATLV